MAVQYDTRLFRPQVAMAVHPRKNFPLSQVEPCERKG